MNEVTVKIAGYRQLTQGEQDLINEGKALGEQIDAYLRKIEDMPLQFGHADMRWIEIARTQLQQGMMAAVRAIAKPKGF